MSSTEKIFSNSLIEKEFLKLLSNPNIKIVSFDIFDTLFFRKCGSAVNVFEIMGENEEIKEKFDTSSAFSLYRQNAEKSARKIHSQKEDITLQEIYEQLPLSRKERERFQEIELVTEKEMLVVNPQLERWINLAIEARKKVIFISDMYLSSSQLEKIAFSKLIDKNKIFKVYISNEYKKMKSTGNLFIHVLKELNLEPNELLHIGDNLRSDIIVAQGFDIQTLYYGHNLEQKKRVKHETFYMQEGLNYANHIRYLSSLLNPYENELQKFYFDIGTSVFAPILWEFSHWLALIKKQHKREKFSFIMREGAIFEQCFKELYPEVETNLFYASRKSTNFLTLRAEDIGSVNFSMYKNFTLQNLYQSFFLEIENENIKPYKLLLCQDLDSIFIDKRKLLTLVLEDIKIQEEKIQEALCTQNKCLSLYLKELNINKKTALIDFGGSGTIIKRLVAFLPEEEKPSTNILFYQHAQGYTKLLEEHVLSFLPYTKKTAHAIQSIHRTPEFLEILLNGIGETTRSYTKVGGKIIPNTYVPSSNKHEITNIIEAFQSGIELFFELAKIYNLPERSHTRENLTLLLARLIELPTQKESELFGVLEYDEGKASDFIYKLIDKNKLEYLQTLGLDKVYQDFLYNPIKYRARIPWIEGAITQLSPNYIVQFYTMSRHPNQEIIETLIEQIDEFKHKKIMVYGAGELFVQLVPYLKSRNIEIESLIDSRAEVKSFEVEGYKVLSLFEALKEKQNATIVIASGVYSMNIKEKIISFAQKSQKNIVCIGSDL